MEVVYFLLPLALLLVLAAAIAFWWACRDGQFDDLETPPMRMLFEDRACAQRTHAGHHPISSESTRNNAYQGEKDR
jgi:cbb3-type cytochrome oxidase maturation protein